MPIGCQGEVSTQVSPIGLADEKYANDIWSVGFHEGGKCVRLTEIDSNPAVMGCDKRTDGLTDWVKPVKVEGRQVRFTQ